MDRVECGHRERPAVSAARTATRRRPAVSRAHAFNEAFALDVQSQRFAPPHDWAQSSNENAIKNLQRRLFEIAPGNILRIRCERASVMLYER